VASTANAELVQIQARKTFLFASNRCSECRPVPKEKFGVRSAFNLDSQPAGKSHHGTKFAARCEKSKDARQILTWPDHGALSAESSSTGRVGQVTSQQT
jgi:hypothetical protein